MTVVATRPLHAGEAAVLRRDLPVGTRDLLVVYGLLGVLSLAIGIAISPALGALALAITAVAALADAHYHTPRWIWVDERHVVLGYWLRSKRLSPRWVVLRHDVRRDRFVLARKGKRRTLVRFRDRDASTVTRAFIAAGVEIVSR